MINLIIRIVVLAIIYFLVSLIPLPSPFPTIVKVLFIIIAVVMILTFLGIATGISI